MNEIPLVGETIDTNDFEALKEWLNNKPFLTKNSLTLKFEKAWSKYTGRKYSIFVNSGSSANLMMIYAAKIFYIEKDIPRYNVLIPSLAWSTTVSPFIQFGFNPIICDINKKTLGIDLKDIIKKEYKNPGIIIYVNVLGLSNNIEEIKNYCDKKDIIFLEDSCESIGSTINGKQTGTFGEMSTYSFFYSHTMSTIEGGMVCTDNKKLYELLLMLRSHGWDRDLPKHRQKQLQLKYNIKDFHKSFTIYKEGFNVRNTDLSAFLGLRQMKKLKYTIQKRNDNFRLYNKLIKNKYWKVKYNKDDIIDNFAYPLIHPKVDKIIKELNKNKIGSRPLICGSIERQPFYYERYGQRNNLKFANIVHDYGMYLPNYPSLTSDDIKRICKIVNKCINNVEKS